MFKINDNTFRPPERVINKTDLITSESSEEDIAGIIEYLVDKERHKNQPSKAALENMDEDIRTMLAENKVWFGRKGTALWQHCYLVCRNAGNKAFPKFDMVCLLSTSYLFSHRVSQSSYWFFDDEIDEKEIPLFKGQTCHISGASACYGDHEGNIQASGISLPDCYAMVKVFLDSLYRDSQFRSFDTSGLRISYMMGLSLNSNDYPRSFQIIEEYFNDGMKPMRIRKELEEAITASVDNGDLYHQYVKEQSKKNIAMHYISTGGQDAYDLVPVGLRLILDNARSGRFGRLHGDFQQHIYDHKNLMRLAIQRPSAVRFFKELEATKSPKEAKKFIANCTKKKLGKLSNAKMNEYQDSFDKATKGIEEMYKLTMKIYGDKLTAIATGITQLEERQNERDQNAS